MTAATIYTYDDSPPRRPGLEDLGGADYENEPGEPPDHATMPNAEAMNEQARNLAGVNRVAPLAILHVTFTAGTPSIASVRGMRTSLLAANFTVTDNGVGDTSITWASTILPASTVPPMATIAEDVEIDRVRAFLVTGGARVKTKLGASATDANFVLVIR